MSTLTIHPTDMDQETAVRMFLDALHINYKISEKEVDATEYLQASPAMKERLEIAKMQEKNGEGIKIRLDDIWK